MANEPPPQSRGRHQSADDRQVSGRSSSIEGDQGVSVRLSREQLERHVLVVLLRTGGIIVAKDLGATIRRELGVPAQNSRIYPLLGDLVDRGHATVGPELCFDGRRNRTQTVVRLTHAGREAAAAIDTCNYGAGANGNHA